MLARAVSDSVSLVPVGVRRSLLGCRVQTESRDRLGDRRRHELVDRSAARDARSDVRRRDRDRLELELEHAIGLRQALTSGTNLAPPEFPAARRQLAVRARGRARATSNDRTRRARRHRGRRRPRRACAPRGNRPCARGGSSSTVASGISANASCVSPSLVSAGVVVSLWPGAATTRTSSSGRPSSAIAARASAT